MTTKVIYGTEFTVYAEYKTNAAAARFLDRLVSARLAAGTRVGFVGIQGFNGRYYVTEEA